MEVVKPILLAAALATVLALTCLAFVTASGRLIDIGAAILALATWVAPLLLIAASWNRKPKSSLASVGSAIGLFVVAACLSVMGISLAVLTLVFAQDAKWAWPALVVIAAFWVAGAIWLNVARRRARAAREAYQSKPGARMMPNTRPPEGGL